MPRESEIKIRRGNYSAWNVANPVLSDGEPGYESTNNTIKIGNSLSHWDDLPEVILSVNPSVANGASKFYPVTFSSPLVNFKITGDAEIFDIPSGYMFFIDRMEVVTTEITSAGTAPYVRFGKTGSLSAFLSATLSESNSFGARHIIDYPQQGESSTAVTFGVTVASTASEHKGYGIVKGYLLPVAQSPATTAAPAATTATPLTTPTPSSSSSSSLIISCPAPWMNILLDDGTQIPAGELRSGMKVRTAHEETLEWGSYEISAVTTVMSPRLKMTIGEKEFVCSPSHKFWNDRFWIEASALTVGSKLDGLLISEISEYEYGEVVRITVDQAHTYVCEGLLSHNKSQPPGTTRAPGTTQAPG